MPGKWNDGVFFLSVRRDWAKVWDGSDGHWQLPRLTVARMVTLGFSVCLMESSFLARAAVGVCVWRACSLPALLASLLLPTQLGDYSHSRRALLPTTCATASWHVTQQL